MLDRVLASGPPTGAWFLHGDAERLREEAARRLAEAALDPGTRDFNFDRFRADETSAEELAAALAMPPMMAERRVVSVHGVENLPTAARKVLVGALERLPPDLVLIVTATVPRRSKAAFYRALKKGCRTLEWTTPRAAEIPGWIVERARERWGLEMPIGAARELATAVGEDVSRLDLELEKLRAGGEEVTPERVRELIPRSRRMDRWTWLDLVAARKYEVALRELDSLLTSESGVGLVAGMVEQHLFVGLAVEGGPGAVRRALSETGRGYLSWKADSFGKQARAWRPGEVDRALRHLHRADRLLKSGGGDRPVLTELLLTLERERRERT